QDVYQVLDVQPRHEPLDHARGQPGPLVVEPPRRRTLLLSASCRHLWPFKRLSFFTAVCVTRQGACGKSRFTPRLIQTMSCTRRAGRPRSKTWFAYQGLNDGYANHGLKLVKT